MFAFLLKLLLIRTIATEVTGELGVCEGDRPLYRSAEARR